MEEKRKEIENWIVLMLKADMSNESRMAWAWIKPMKDRSTMEDAIVMESMGLRETMMSMMELPQPHPDEGRAPHDFLSLGIMECSESTREGYSGAELVNSHRPNVVLDLTMCAAAFDGEVKARASRAGEEVFGPVKLTGVFELCDLVGAAHRLALASREARDLRGGLSDPGVGNRRAVL